VVAAGTAWYLSAWRFFFFYAIRSNSVTLARTMLKMGTDANATLSGESPLTVALDGPSPLLATVQLLLEFRADPNRLDANGMEAPLEKVHGPDAFAIFDALLTAGANIKACSRKGSILHHARSVPYAEFLLSRGADVNLICETTGTTPLYSIVANPELVSLYLEHGAKIVPDAWHKITPLHRVASFSHHKNSSGDPSDLKSAEILVAHGADINAVDYSGRTALDSAYETANKDIADLLVEHGGKSLKFKSMEEGEESHAAEDEYQDLYMFPEGRRNGPACSLNLVGESRNIMEEGHSWSIVKGTVAVVHVNCHASGFFHYVVLGMGPPVPKRLNMPLMGGIPGSEKITFDQMWSNGIMHWYYSPEPITNLVKALKKGTATHFAVRNVTVGE
jgi:ankyrin repeat protein